MNEVEKSIEKVNDLEIDGILTISTSQWKIKKIFPKAKVLAVESLVAKYKARISQEVWTNCLKGGAQYEPPKAA